MKLTIVIALLSCLSNLAHSQALSVYTHSSEAATYTDNQGQLRGKPGAGRRAFLVELVREMMIAKELIPEIIHLPLKRGILTLKSQPATALFNINRTPQREALFKWVGPLQSDTVHFFENTEHPSQTRSLADARQVDAICVRSGNSHITDLHSQGFTNLVLANSYRSCWEMLKRQRVSLITLGGNLAPYLNKHTQTNPGQIRSTGVVLSETAGYLAFSADTPDSTITSWQNTLNLIIQSGRYQQLVDQYFILSQDCLDC